MVGVVNSIPTRGNFIFADFETPWCQFCTKMPEMSDLCNLGKTRMACMLFENCEYHNDLKSRVFLWWEELPVNTNCARSWYTYVIKKFLGIETFLLLNCVGIALGRIFLKVITLIIQTDIKEPYVWSQGCVLSYIREDNCIWYLILLVT